MDEYKKFINFVEEIIPIYVEPALDKYINQEKNNIMGNLSHINSYKKATAVVESVEILWKEGKTIKDYITQGLKTGRQEGRQAGIQEGIQKGIQEGKQEGQLTNLTNIILKMNKKGFSTNDIANILEVDINFVKNAIAKQI